MANQFRVNQLLLSGQRVTANGTNLYLNGEAVGVNTDGSTISGNLTITGQALLNAIASTGQQAWIAANNNARNLSGNLVLTGQIAQNNALNLSGNLALTGQQAWTAANNNGINLSGNISAVSGNLTLTGQALRNNDLNLSGNLALTGQQAWSTADNNARNLSGNINALSGNLTLTGQIAQNNALNLSGNLALTGQQAWLAADNNGRNLSGNVNAISGNLTLTGQIAQNNALNLSGAIAATGQQAWVASQNNALNLSGRLIATGALLSAVQVTGSTLMQTPNFSGMGGTLVIQSGNFVLISGAAGGTAAANNNDGINLSGQLTLTGQTAQNNALNLSGNLASTGQQAWNAANNNGINLSGNVSAISGNLTLTGQTLRNNDLNLSGNLALTGQQAWLAANNNGINLSGNVSAISGNLTLTGQIAQSNALNLSGTISVTGSVLWDRDLSISGGLEARMSAGGTTISVTGSTFLSTADFSGLGGTLVIRSGNRVFISGDAGATSSAVLPSSFSIPVTQNTHGFSPSDAIRVSSTNGIYVKALADNSTNAEVVGMVNSITDANNFTYTTAGIVTGNFVAGANNVLYLSPSVSGALTDIEPSAVGQVSKPLVVVTVSGFSGVLLNMRGMTITSSTAQTLNINRKYVNYTLQMEDAENVVQMNISSSGNVSVPAYSSVPFPVGTSILIEQFGVGQVSVLGDPSVTIYSRDSANKTVGRYSMASLIKTSGDIWNLGGDITP